MTADTTAVPILPAAMGWAVSEPAALDGPRRVRFRSAAVNRLAPLFDAARDGVHTLPDTVLRAEKIARRLAEARGEITPPDVATARRQLEAAFVTAAADDGKWPDAAALVKAEDARRRYDAQLRVITSAREDAEQALESAVSWGTADIIAAHLRPALERLLAEIRPAAQTFRPFVAAPPAKLLRASDDVRAAAGVLATAADTYDRLRASQYVLDKPASDSARWLSDYRNLTELWGNRWRAYHLTTWRPWPAGDRRAFMVWLAGVMDDDPTPDVWMPTPTEWREQWTALFGAGRPMLGGAA